MKILSTRLDWVVGMGVGVAISIGAQNALWGLAAGLAAFLLVRQFQPRPSAPPEIGTLEPRPVERETSIEVVCKTVTPARQEWVSLKTGRLYDVLSVNGLAGARPGDRGKVTLVGTTWKIVPLTPPSDVDSSPVKATLPQDPQ